jgi:hypothetical protein
MIGKLGRDQRSGGRDQKNKDLRCGGEDDFQGRGLDIHRWSEEVKEPPWGAGPPDFKNWSRAVLYLPGTVFHATINFMISPPRGNFGC